VNSFARLLAAKIDDYIRLRRSLGYSFESQGSTLAAFRDFAAARRYPGPLTGEVAMTFVLSCDVTPNVRAWRHGVLRRFAEYLSVFDARTEMLDARALRRCRAIPPARILGDDELAGLLVAARDGWSHQPLRGLTLSTLVGLLASTGMRSGEALRLDRADVDLSHAVVQIRRTKFRKDRLVPVHSTTCQVLAAYASARDIAFPRAKSSAFFLSLRGSRLTSSALSSAFRQASTRAGLDDGAPRPPRPHDLRHRFAVTRLIAWHREGVDVQAHLPLLATYLGHVHYTDTAYYVTGTPELLAVAAERAFGTEEDAL
jgi:integrase